MEGEIRNFIGVWITVLASLCYCHTIGKFIPKGTTRLFSILPITCLFIYLPLHLTTIHLGSTTAFFIAWLANFKLLLFAFGKGPLSSHPPLSLPHFLLFSCLPIKAQHHRPSPQNPKKCYEPRKIFPLDTRKIEYPGQIHSGCDSCRTKVESTSSCNTCSSDILQSTSSENVAFLKNLKKLHNTEIEKYPSHQISKNPHKSRLNYATKILLLAILFQVYKYKEFVHPKLVMVLYCLHIYFSLELLLVIVAAVARAAAHLELEPQFDEPYLSTSLQDFWGRRWNLMVTSIMRPTVYDPVRSISSRLIGKKWAPIPAIIATFLVSGVMHELIFYYAGRLRPTLEVTGFFLLHGVCLAAETVVKKALKGKFRVPAVVTGPAAIGFVVVTGLWLFFPPVMRFEADVMARRETAAIVEFAKDVIRVSNIWILKGNNWIGNTFVSAVNLN